MGKQTKNIAGISLGVMSVGFIATLPFPTNHIMYLIRNGFEAGLVGGLADWFAVTALFRHPLGIPIPHTALLPNNREKVTQSLITVVEKELLNKESILQKLQQVSISQNILQFAEKQLLQPAVQKAIISIIVNNITKLEAGKFVPFVQREMEGYLNRIELTTIIDNLLDEVRNKGYDEKAFDYILNKAEFWVSQPESRDSIGRMALTALGKLEVNGLMQFALNAFIGFMNEEKLGSMIQNVIFTTIDDLRKPDGVRRNNIMSVIREELSALKHHNPLFKALEAWKQQWISQLELESKLNQMFSELQNRAAAFVLDERFAEDYMVPFGTGLIHKLSSDAERIEQFESWIHVQLAEMLENHHLQIGNLVRENLDKLDNKTLTEMLEEKIGQDLQWIRVNGAVCGFLIGIVLGGIKLLT